MRCLIFFACLLLVSCASMDQTVDKSGFATTDDGVQIHYRLLGPKNAPVILVGYPWTRGWVDIMEDMGAGRAGEGVSQQIIEMLTPKYRVLYVDYPRGTGASTGPLPGDLTPDTVAQDYVAVADAAGVDRFVAQGSLRLSLGHTSTEADVDRALEVVPAAVERLCAHGGG